MLVAVIVAIYLTNELAELLLVRLALAGLRGLGQPLAHGLDGVLRVKASRGAGWTEAFGAGLVVLAGRQLLLNLAALVEQELLGPIAGWGQALLLAVLVELVLVLNVLLLLMHVDLDVEHHLEGLAAELHKEPLILIVLAFALGIFLIGLHLSLGLVLIPELASWLFLFRLDGVLYLFEYFEEHLLIYQVLDLATVVQELSQVECVYLWKFLLHLSVDDGVLGPGAGGRVGEWVQLGALARAAGLDVTVDESLALIVIHLLDVVNESSNALSVHLIDEEALEHGLLDLHLLGFLQVLLVQLAHPRLVLAYESLVDFLLAGSHSRQRLPVSLDPDVPRRAHDLERPVPLVQNLLINDRVEVVEDPVHLTVKVIRLYHLLALLHFWMLLLLAEQPRGLLGLTLVGHSPARGPQMHREEGLLKVWQWSQLRLEPDRSLPALLLAGLGCRLLV